MRDINQGRNIIQALGQHFHVIRLWLSTRQHLESICTELVKGSETTPIVTLRHLAWSREDAGRVKRVFKRRSPHAPTIVHQLIKHDNRWCAWFAHVPLSQTNHLWRACAERARFDSGHMLPEPNTTAPDLPRRKLQEIAQDWSTVCLRVTVPAASPSNERGRYTWSTTGNHMPRQERAVAV